VNLSGYSIKGKNKEFNQDYFLIKNNKFFISDGCSSVPYSDLGSRMLVHGASVEQTLDVILDSADNLGLEPESLCATLLSGEVDEWGISLKMEGDGVVIWKEKDCEKLLFYEVKFQGNAPYYPIYNQLGIQHTKIGQLFYNSKEGGSGSSYSYRNSEHVYELNWYWKRNEVLNLEWLCVCTDGISEYREQWPQIFNIL